MVTSKVIPSGACPASFRALCRTASGDNRGGYLNAGYGLAREIANLAPQSVGDEHWIERVEDFDRLLDAGDDRAALEWLDAHLPRCMLLVPRPRRQRFLNGIRQWVTDNECGVADTY
jgi:hypothetical protein